MAGKGEGGCGARRGKPARGKKIGGIAGRGIRRGGGAGALFFLVGAALGAAAIGAIGGAGEDAELAGGFGAFGAVEIALGREAAAQQFADRRRAARHAGGKAPIVKRAGLFGGQHYLKPRVALVGSVRHGASLLPWACIIWGIWCLTP